MSQPVYEVLLEKKGRGRNILSGRPWAVRTFKLRSQTLEYYDGDRLKGAIDIANSKTAKISVDEADGKTFPFAISTKDEKLILNASCEEIRVRCIEIFNFAAKDKNWTLEPPTKVEKAQADFDSAATKAVASVFAENAEKARLEEEQRKLEEERQREVTAAAAKVLEEEMANKKIREAKEAEERQREEQERQVMNLMKGLGAKARFKTAIQHGKMAVAREAAACMVQGAYRAKLARRRMLLKKAEKERLREEGYASKIQCRYRARLARKRVEQIKQEKLAIKRKLSAMKVQCAWRIFIARKKYHAKQAMKLEAELRKSKAKQRGIILIQNLIRAFIAKRRVHRIASTYPSVAFVAINRVDGLANGASDCQAYVSGTYLNLPVNHPARTNPIKKVSDELLKSSAKVSSHYKIESVTTKHMALATCLTFLDFITITLVEKGSKDDFLGQVTIRVSEIRDAASRQPNRTVDLTIPLHSQLLVPIVDENKQSLATVRKASTGVINVSITLPDPAYTMCGWLYKVSESLLSGGAWKKRWFVLVDDELQYFNSELQLEASKNVVVCNTITAIKEESHKGRQATKICYNGGDWMIDWDENANAAINRMWLRKIYRSSPGLADPTMQELKAKLGGLKVATGTHDKGVSPHGKTKVPVSKRMSVFK